MQQAFDVRSNSWHMHSYVHTLTHIQHFHASTVLCKQPRETRTLTQALKARQKFRMAGPTIGCRPKKQHCIEEKQRVSQTAVRDTQKSKQTICINIYICTHAHSRSVCMYDCMSSESESASLVTTAEVLYMCNKHLMLGQIAGIYTRTYTHSHTFNTFTQAQYSINSHEKHAHSRKR